MQRIDIKDFLDEKLLKYNHSSFIETDPIQLPKLFSSKEDIEIAGFLAATISWGNRQSIIKNGRKLMQLMEFEPHNFIVYATNKELDRFSGFVHRTFNSEDVTYFVKSLRNIYIAKGGLQQVFSEGFALENSVWSALVHFREVFFEPGGERTRKHISNAAKGASCKRLNMFLRWMVRNDNTGVDFGLWDNIPASELMLPLDIHTGNVARKLGLLVRKQDDRKAVEEVTGVLKEFDPTDPIKYDFALFGLGIFEKF